MRAYTTFDRREHPRLKPVAGASVMVDDRSYQLSDCSEGGLLCVDYYGPHRAGDVVEMLVIAAQEDTPQQSFRLRAEVMRYDEGQRSLAVKFRLPDDERGNTFRHFIREYLTDGSVKEDMRKPGTKRARPSGREAARAESVSAA